MTHRRSTMLTLVAVLALSAPGPVSFACHPGLVVVGYEAAWDALSVDIDNPTSEPQSGGIALDFVMDGQRHHWWFAGIEVPAETEWQVTMGFPSTLTVLGVKVCGERPHGVVDAPEPVASRTKQEKRKK